MRRESDGLSTTWSILKWGLDAFVQDVLSSSTRHWAPGRLQPNADFLACVANAQVEDLAPVILSTAVSWKEVKQVARNVWCQFWINHISQKT